MAYIVNPKLKEAFTDFGLRLAWAKEVLARQEAAANLVLAMLDLIKDLSQLLFSSNEGDKALYDLIVVPYQLLLLKLGEAIATTGGASMSDYMAARAAYNNSVSNLDAARQAYNKLAETAALSRMQNPDLYTTEIPSVKTLLNNRSATYNTANGKTIKDDAASLMKGLVNSRTLYGDWKHILGNLLWERIQLNGISPEEFLTMVKNGTVDDMINEVLAANGMLSKTSEGNYTSNGYDANQVNRAKEQAFLGLRSSLVYKETREQKEDKQTASNISLNALKALYKYLLDNPKPSESSSSGGTSKTTKSGVTKSWEDETSIYGLRKSKDSSTEDNTAAIPMYRWDLSDTLAKEILSAVKKRKWGWKLLTSIDEKGNYSFGDNLDAGSSDFIDANGSIVSGNMPALVHDGLGGYFMKLNGLYYKISNPEEFIDQAVISTLDRFERINPLTKTSLIQDANDIVDYYSNRDVSLLTQDLVLKLKLAMAVIKEYEKSLNGIASFGNTVKGKDLSTEITLQ